MLMQQSNTSTNSEFELSQAHFSSPQHTLHKWKWDQPREQRREEKEDKSNDLTPLGLREIRNGEEEGMRARVFLVSPMPNREIER